MRIHSLLKSMNLDLEIQLAAKILLVLQQQLRALTINFQMVTLKLMALERPLLLYMLEREINRSDYKIL